MSHPLNSLLTGIPRSGTTLCCKLLNQLNNTIALHEPINPTKLTFFSGQNLDNELSNVISQLRIAVTNEKSFEHGSSEGIILDNPIGERASESGLRLPKIKRGIVTVPKQTADVHLIVKQNALFAALASSLIKRYPMVAIVRNPVHVLLSWWTVDLPVNKGRLPAGVRFDRSLERKLSSIDDVIQRQIVIYRWFIDKYTRACVPVLRYEDIINSSGEVLFRAFSKEQATEVSLSALKRKFSGELLSLMNSYIQDIVVELNNEFYSENDIQEAYQELLSESV